MIGSFRNKSAARKDYSDCSGCSLCLLVCPVWRQRRDISLTPHGYAKALQHGAVAVSAGHCTLCMACEPVCPENIDIIGMILELRRQLDAPVWLHGLQPSEKAGSVGRGGRRGASSSTLLCPPLHEHHDTLARIAVLLEIPISDDDGSDISLALEAGADISEKHLEMFLAPLRQWKKIIVADGLLLRHLKQWLPKTKIIGLGEALSGHAGVRRNLRPTDLYVIEPRAYHSDYQRLVKYYDSLRIDCGCAFNLDLQRIAIPATVRNLPQRLGFAAQDNDGQARWLLHGRNFTRIVVESLEDRAALEKVSNVPVVHLAELADDGVCV